LIGSRASATADTTSNKYAKSAEELLQKGDLRGAEIQLHNAIRDEPQNGDYRLMLARVYLGLNNPAAAEGEALAAKQRNVDDDHVAPVLAEALLREGQANKLLQTVPAGNRPPAAESAVRLMRALASLQLGDRTAAAALLHDAEQLNPQAVGPKVALAFLLISNKDFAAARQKAGEALTLRPKDSDALDAMGTVLAATGDTDDALQHFSDAITQNPNNFRARRHRANLLVQLDQLAKAQTDLDFLLKAGPRDVMSIYLQALVYAKQKKFADANQTLEKASGNFGQLPAAFYLDGMIKYFLGQYDLAEQSLERFVARVPKAPRAHEILGVIALRRGDFQKALQEAKTALEAAPDDAATLSLLGRTNMAIGKPKEALAAFEAALHSAPDSPTLQTGAALSRLEAGDTGGALAELENTFETSAKADGAAPPLIISALRAGRVSTAASVAEEFAKREPTNTLAQNLLGVARFAEHDYTGAEQAFRVLLDKHPEFVSVRRNLAQVYIATNRADDARALFREAIRKNPADTVSLIALADIEIQQKNVDEAKKLLLQGQDAHSDNPAAVIRLMELYGSQKQWDAAITLARKMDAQFSSNVAFLDIYGRTLVASGDVQNGLIVLRRALAIAPKSVPLLRAYAAALLVAKDTQGAQDTFAKAVVLNPSDESLKVALVETAYAAGGKEAAHAAARSVTFEGADDPLASIILAMVLSHVGKLDDAIDTLTKIRPEAMNGHATRMLAELYIAKGEQQHGLQLLRSWLDSSPKDSTTRSVFASALMGGRDYDGAIAEYERLSKDQPQDFIALNNLAWLYLQKDDARALDAAKAAYKISAGAPPVADTLGWILLKKGDVSAAEPYLASAVAALPNNPDIQYHWAAALYRSGKKPEAQAILEKITATQVNFSSKPDAQKLLADIKGG